MKTLKLGHNGDLVIENNSFKIISQIDEIDQYIRTVLNIRKGEWFLDTELGLSHENILGKDFDKNKIEFDVIEALRQEERVEDILELDIKFDRQDRKLSIYFKITTSENKIIERRVDI